MHGGQQAVSFSGLNSPQNMQVAGEEDAERPVKVFLDVEFPAAALSPKVPTAHSILLPLQVFTQKCPNMPQTF